MNRLLSNPRMIMFRDMLTQNPNLDTIDTPPNNGRFPTLEHITLLGGYAGSTTSGLGLLNVEFLDFHRIALAGGDSKAFNLLELLLEKTTRLFTRNFPDCNILFIEGYGLGENVIFFDHPKLSPIQLARSYSAIRLEFEEMVHNQTIQALGESANVLLGYAIMNPGRRGDVPRALVKGLCEARHFARTVLDDKELNMRMEFLQIQEENSFVPVYQPILDFSNGATMGWESFSRGPQGSSFYNPVTFFKFAEQIGAVFELDQLCRESAIRNLGDIHPEQILFVNTHPMSLNNSRFSPESTIEMLKKHDLKPENIVLEFSEKQNLHDPSLLRLALAPYIAHGFKVAVDDVGGGHCSLRLLSQVRPHYVKLDPTLIHGVDANPYKRLMIDVLIYLAKKIDAMVIAVGLETEEEFSSLVSMGVRAGQGFLLSGPEALKKEVTVSLPTGASWQEARDSGWKCSKPVCDMVEEPLTVAPETTVEEVKKLLDEKPPNSNVIVALDDRPVGQLMSYNLDRRLGTRYGISLYMNREVTHLMNADPLIVDGSTSVEDVAKLAMQRKGPQIYDDIIATDSGKLIGTVSVQKMLDYLAQFQVELAKGSNPLTGLPGNLAIEHEIERRIGNKISSSLIYIDLDNFKVYNDVYGFGKGDQVILMTSRVLQQAIQEVGSVSDFIGHVGGDDFIIISSLDKADDIGQRLIDLFQDEIPGFYTDEHRAQGFINAVGRDGIRREFQFVSVSIGIIDFEFNSNFTLADLSNRAAMIKKYAKSKQGNSCVRDRRSPLGSEKSDEMEIMPEELRE